MCFMHMMNHSVCHYIQPNRIFKIIPVYYRVIFYTFFHHYFPFPYSLPVPDYSVSNCQVSEELLVAGRMMEK